jgi:hypothetical protein
VVELPGPDALDERAPLGEVVTATTSGASLSRMCMSPSGPVAISIQSPLPPPLNEDFRHTSWDIFSSSYRLYMTCWMRLNESRESWDSGVASGSTGASAIGQPFKHLRALINVYAIPQEHRVQRVFEVHRVQLGHAAAEGAEGAAEGGVGARLEREHLDGDVGEPCRLAPNSPTPPCC